MKLIISCFLVLPFISLMGQEITSSKIDGFTNELTVETSVVTLKQGLSTGFGASYSAVNKNYYLNIIGYGKSGTVITDADKIWLVLTDSSVVKLEYRAELPYNESDIQNIYVHHYVMRLDEIEILKHHEVVMVRIVSPNGNTDINLPGKSSKKFLKLSDIFLREVSKDS